MLKDATHPLEPAGVPDLLHGGMLYRVTRRFAVEPEHVVRAVRPAMLLGLLLWLPMAVAALLQGRALPGSVDVPFLFDVAAYVRPLLCVPLLLVAEPILEAAWRQVGAKLHTRGLVDAGGRAAYDALVERCSRSGRRLLPELLCLGIAGTLSFRLVVAVQAGSHDAWYATSATPGASTATIAGLWYAFVVHGSLFFLTLRWIWLLSVWYRFLFGVARLPLHLLPTHADRAAGLGFIGKTIVAGAPLAGAWSAALASVAANHMIHGGQRLAEYAPLGVVLPVLVLLVFVLPPVVIFAPLLVRTRREALESWSRRMARCAEGARAADPSDPGGDGAGAAELGLEDLAIAVAAVRALRPVPIGLGPIVGLVIATAVPVVPLLFLAFPARDIFDKLMQLVA